jgi:hypothetical protein
MPHLRGEAMRRREFVIGGLTAALPLTARAQTAMPTVGYLSSASYASGRAAIDSFLRGLKEGGFVVGQNISMEYRWAMANTNCCHRLPQNLSVNVLQYSSRFLPLPLWPPRSVRAGQLSPYERLVRTCC